MNARGGRTTAMLESLGGRTFKGLYPPRLSVGIEQARCVASA
jgi:hypothetical protein